MVISLTVDAAKFPFTWGLTAGPLIVVVVAQICFWPFWRLGLVLGLELRLGQSLVSCFSEPQFEQLDTFFCVAHETTAK